MDSPSPPETPDVLIPEVLVDINTASQRKLLKLPGIGRALATQIQAARPFSSVDDLRRVPGITAEMIEKLRPFTVASQPAVSAPAESQQESVSVPGTMPPQPEESLPSSAKVEPQPSAEAESEPIPAAQTETASPPSKGVETEFRQTALVPVSPLRYDERYVKVEQAIWMVIGSGIVSLILALFFAFAILTAINGSLRFVTKAEMVPLNLDIEAIKSQAETLNQDLKGVRQRLDNLEGMSGRMNSLEASVETMQSEVKAAIQQVEDMHTTVTQLSEQASQVQTRLEAIQAETSRYQLFLDGLRDLLNRLTQTQGTQR